MTSGEVGVADVTAAAALPERLAEWRTGRAGSPPRTRFAPAPTGFLHLGHVANAIYVWGVAALAGASVTLRIEDHDRSRCRRGFETALLDDLEWLGFLPDEPAIPALRGGASAFRQSDSGEVYAAALDELRSAGLVYACDCTRSTFAAWETAHGRPFADPGCPGECRRRALAEEPGRGVRVVVGGGEERFEDLRLGPQRGDPSASGDLLARDRNGQWTYIFAVVVDDMRHGIDLVIRGEDLLADTPRQLRLGRLVGRTAVPAFLHHSLIRKASGAKLSKADGDTSIRELRRDGATAAALIGRAAAVVGLIDRWRPIPAADVRSLFER